MAQKEAKAMKELATESKKDSSAMKTIALLGMVFFWDLHCCKFPGTSVFEPLNSNFENGHKGNTHICSGNFLDASFQLGW